MATKFIAITYGVNRTTHSTAALARRALATHRREINASNPGFAGPYPHQQIVRVENGKKTIIEYRRQ